MSRVTPPRFSDEAIDGLRIVWAEEPGYSGPRVEGCPTELRILKDFLSTGHWQRFVQFIAPGVLARHGRGVECSGFLFPEDFDAEDFEEEGVEPFEGVQLYDPIDTIHVSQPAFDRLMSRYFDTIVEAVQANRRPEAAEDWWPTFEGSARELRRRAERT
jgi:hypothetical protein